MVNLDVAAVYLSGREGPYCFRSSPSGSRRNDKAFPHVSAIAGLHWSGGISKGMSLVATALQHGNDGQDNPPVIDPLRAGLVLGQMLLDLRPCFIR